MKDKWQEYWDSLLKEQRILDYVKELNKLENDNKTEKICHKIFDEYPRVSEELEQTRENIIKQLEKMDGVYLHTSRVKELESLLKKIIVKRHECFFKKKDPYSKIDGSNYSEIIGDLVGIRVIVSYRGNWKRLHHQITSQFAYKSLEAYKNEHFIRHNDGEQFIAEIPKVYYAYGDDISMYEDEQVECILKETGYRSVHYILSFQNVYVELQVRTIYDEAWSDCDHRYVYKQEDNHSHDALKELSGILNDITYTANELGDDMQAIFEDEAIRYTGANNYLASEGIVDKLKMIEGRLNHTVDLYSDFMRRLTSKEGERND